MFGNGMAYGFRAAAVIVFKEIFKDLVTGHIGKSSGSGAGNPSSDPCQGKNSFC